jgi:hypothetical protein
MSKHLVNELGRDHWSLTRRFAAVEVIREGI